MIEALGEMAKRFWFFESGVAGLVAATITAVERVTLFQNLEDMGL